MMQHSRHVRNNDLLEHPHAGPPLTQQHHTESLGEPQQMRRMQLGKAAVLAVLHHEHANETVYIEDCVFDRGSRDTPFLDECGNLFIIPIIPIEYHPRRGLAIV